MPKAAPVQPTKDQQFFIAGGYMASRRCCNASSVFLLWPNIPAHEVWLNATRLALGFLPCIGVWEVSGRSDRSVSTKRIDPPARGSLPRQGTRRGPIQPHMPPPNRAREGGRILDGKTGAHPPCGQPLLRSLSRSALCGNGLCDWRHECATRRFLIRSHVSSLRLAAGQMASANNFFGTQQQDDPFETAYRRNRFI